MTVVCDNHMCKKKPEGVKQSQQNKKILYVTRNDQWPSYIYCKSLNLKWNEGG